MAGYGSPAKHPDAESYRLDMGQKTAEVMQIYCDGSLWNGDLGADGGMQGSWLFFTNTDQVVLRWYDETILVLDRIPENQRPTPSFDCSKTITPTANEICHSIELSAFDRSVSAAYKLALSQTQGASNDSSSLARRQKTWLAVRNKCDADKSCILAFMRTRLDELSVPSQ